MDLPKKAPRRNPPWWCLLIFYLATWPDVEFKDFRIRLQRAYLRELRKNGSSGARNLAIRRTLDWAPEVFWRIFRLIGLEELIRRWFGF